MYVRRVTRVALQGLRHHSQFDSVRQIFNRPAAPSLAPRDTPETTIEQDAELISQALKVYENTRENDIFRNIDANAKEVCDQTMPEEMKNSLKMLNECRTLSEFYFHCEKFAKAVLFPSDFFAALLFLRLNLIVEFIPEALREVAGVPTKDGVVSMLLKARAKRSSKENEHLQENRRVYYAMLDMDNFYRNIVHRRPEEKVFFELIDGIFGILAAHTTFVKVKNMSRYKEVLRLAIQAYGDTHDKFNMQGLINVTNEVSLGRWDLTVGPWCSHAFHLLHNTSAAKSHNNGRSPANKDWWGAFRNALPNRHINNYLQSRNLDFTPAQSEFKYVVQRNRVKEQETEVPKSARFLKREETALKLFEEELKKGMRFIGDQQKDYKKWRSYYSDRETFYRTMQLQTNQKDLEWEDAWGDPHSGDFPSTLPTATIDELGINRGVLFINSLQ